MTFDLFVHGDANTCFSSFLVGTDAYHGWREVHGTGSLYIHASA